MSTPKIEAVQNRPDPYQDSGPIIFPINAKIPHLQQTFQTGRPDGMAGDT